MSNGDSIEAATVGREGASWISASVGARSMPCEPWPCTTHVLKLAVEDLDRELKENGPFRDVLTEYSHALLIATMRTSACNGLHRLQERCARWIMTTLDRIDGDHFCHEGISGAAVGHQPADDERDGGHLRKGGDSQREGRRVIVADRKRLKEASCECYEVIRHHYLKVGT